MRCSLPRSSLLSRPDRVAHFFDAEVALFDEDPPEPPEPPEPDEPDDPGEPDDPDDEPGLEAAGAFDVPAGEEPALPAADVPASGLPVDLAVLADLARLSVR